MGGLRCTVNLNSDGSGSFYTGNIVTGMVVLELKKDRKIERIDLEVIGTCRAQWTRAKPTIPYIKIYSEKRRLLEEKTKDIFQDVRSGKKMPAGVHRYPFHFVLPEDLPSTFESDTGNIYYYIRIKSKPGFKIKKVVTFNVLNNVNLNHNEQFLMPAEFEYEKKLSCNSGNLQATVRTYVAFAPKQRIPFEIILNNENQVKISKVRLSLIQVLHPDISHYWCDRTSHRNSFYLEVEVSAIHQVAPFQVVNVEKVRYTVSSGYLEEEREMCKVSHKKKSQTPAEIVRFDINIPQIIPTTINITDPMMDVSYIIRVEVVFPYHLTIQEDIPVTVAVIPVVHYSF